jgi:hypothetical protein
MVKMIKSYQEKFYTVKAGIIVNRPVQLTEEMFFRLGARLRCMSHVCHIKSTQVLYYGVKNNYRRQICVSWYLPHWSYDVDVFISMCIGT